MLRSQKSLLGSLSFTSITFFLRFFFSRYIDSILWDKVNDEGDNNFMLQLLLLLLFFADMAWWSL